MNAPKKSIGRAFSQREPLTTRLKGLVRSYPKGLGLFKEFIQNADDAEADDILFVIDERQYETAGLPESMRWLHTGPALLVYNNKPFSEEDIDGIQALNASGKSDSVGKTGRFGLGFNVCYNVTDVPYFITRDEFFCFDPHTSTIPETSHSDAGRRLTFEELDEQGWPLLDALSDCRCEDGTLDGVWFRLPFRTDERASESEISKEPYTVKDALQAVNELQELGSAILLFLKHIRKLTVQHRNKNGRVKELLSFSATNTEEIFDSRKEVNALLNKRDPEEILENLSENGDVYSSCQHEYMVIVDGVKHSETWFVVDGFFVDDERKVISESREMLESDQKAIPYAGAAWPINFKQIPTGRIFCFLPVPVPTSVPVQLNGYFDLDDSRQNMFLDQNVRGMAKLRVNWNETLLQTSVAKAYLKLLDDLPVNVVEADVDSYYGAFPKVVEGDGNWEAWLTQAFYEMAKDAPLHRCAGDEPWQAVADLRSLPHSLDSIADVLIQENFLPLPSPPLPDHVKNGYDSVGVEIPELSPTDLRGQLQEEQDVNCPLEKAPRACLQKREYVTQIFRFCLSDDPGEEISGLPLVIDHRGYLRTVGIRKIYLSKSEWDLEVFCKDPEWFVDPEFAKELGGLTSEDAANLFEMDIKAFLSELAKYVSLYSKDEKVKLSKAREGVLTDPWLQAVFRRLLEADLESTGSVLEEIPLIPDQSGALLPMGDESTPLLFGNGSRSLKKALKELSVPLVSGVSHDLKQLLGDFSKKEELIWYVTPLDLIDTLGRVCSETLKEYDELSDVQCSILDFLSKEENLEKLKGERHREATLESLCIFPTKGGRLIDLDQKAYISTGFEFPSIVLDIALLDDGKEKRWRPLYQLLKVPELTLSQFIREYLLPTIAELDNKQRLRALEWLRNNLEAAMSEDESSGREGLFDVVRDSLIITCEDGEIREPSEIYHPGCEIVRDVFGSQAVFPDMKGSYSQDSKRWVRFFDYLELLTAPRPSDVVEYVDTVIKSPPNNAQVESLQRVFKYFRKQADSELQENNELSDGLSEALADLSFTQWIPIRQEAPGFLCFSQPDETLAFPDGVYFAKFGNLIASQAPIAQFAKEPKDLVKKAMGFPEKPTPRQVQNHFEEVLEEYSVQDTLSVADQRKLEKGLDSIYEHFGKQIVTEAENVYDHLLPGGLCDLEAIFSFVPCIWDSATKRFWRPDQVFSDTVKYMEPWRRTITSKDAFIELGYKSLGRKKTPDINDWKQVLGEIAESDQSPEENDNPKVIKTVIYHIVTELMETDSEDNKVFVPTRKGTMEPSRHVYMPDGLWDGDTLDSWDIPILSGSISDIAGIQSTLGMPRLRDSIVSRLIGEPVASEEESERLECERLEGLLRSSEFIRGMERLCQNELSGIHGIDLSVLDSIQVQSVKAISTGRYHAAGIHECLLDEALEQFYWDAENGRALLLENLGRYRFHHLAKILAGAIEGGPLQDTAPIFEMLNCDDPAEICQVLGALGIPDTEVVSAWRPEVDEEAEEWVTPEVSIEVEELEESEEGPAEYPDADGEDETPEPTPVPDIDDDQRPSSDEYEPEGDAQREDDSSYPEQPEKSDQPERSRVDSTASSRRKSDTTQQREPSETGRSRSSSKEDVPTGTRPNQPSKSEGGSGTENDDAPGDKSVTEKESTASRRQSSTQSRLGSYVSQNGGNGEPRESTEDQQRRIQEVDAGAVSFVLDHEKEQGRIATKMPHENEGYDVKSVDGDQARYIEVKGTDKTWGETGVALTKTQFSYAQKYRNDYWLYVVENVSSNPQLHKIQDPAGKVDRYFFDGGWRQAAIDSQGTANSGELWKPGDEVFVGGNYVGVVEQILKSGKFPLVIYKDIDGKQQRIRLSEVDIRPREG